MINTSVTHYTTPVLRFLTYTLLSFTNLPTVTHYTDPVLSLTLSSHSLTVVGPTVGEVVKIVKDTSSDATVLKYLTRFRQKLKQTPTAEEG